MGTSQLVLLRSFCERISLGPLRLLYLALHFVECSTYLSVVDGACQLNGFALKVLQNNIEFIKLKSAYSI